MNITTGRVIPTRAATHGKSLKQAEWAILAPTSCRDPTEFIQVYIVTRLDKLTIFQKGDWINIGICVSISASCYHQGTSPDKWWMSDIWHEMVVKASK